jgi:salicylate hydroxylase
VQLQSREIGTHVYHPAGAHAALRNAVMSARQPEEWYDQIDWLYGSTGLEGAVSGETRARPMAFAEEGVKNNGDMKK